jgi:hypothetical protein
LSVTIGDSSASEDWSSMDTPWKVRWAAIVARNNLKRQP